MKMLTPILASVALISLLPAQTLIIPSDATPTTVGAGSTSYPWNRDSATATSNDIRVQYFYDSTNITTGMPILINQLRFRANDTAVTTSWTGGTFGNCEIRIGGAAVDYSAITTTFDTNWGGMSPAPAYTGPVTLQPGTGAGTGMPSPWYVTVKLPTPVLYDPAKGVDLLIDIRHDGVFSGATTGAYVSETGGNMCSRMYNTSDWQAVTGSTQQSSGIVCELGYTPVSGLFAGFTVDKSMAGPGETVTFTDTTFSSNPPVMSWIWDFDGDGNPDSAAQNPTWQYTGCGAQDVSLTVVDITGAQNTLTKKGAVTIVAPVASFTFQVMTTQAPFQVQFTDTSKYSPVTWAWDLDGDGATDSAQPNPVWTYATRGAVNVTLDVANGCGSNKGTQLVDTRLSLSTQFGGIAGWTGGSAFYVDVNVTTPLGLTIESLGVQIQTAGIQAGINVYIKPGTHVGSETDRNAWALVSTGTNPSSAGTPNETVIDVSDFSLAMGQWAMAVEYLIPSTERFNYTTSAGTNASNGDVALTNGAMHAPAFGSSTTFSPRNWNGCLYYKYGHDGGLFSVIGDGCSSSTGNIPTIGMQGGGVARIGQTATIETTDAMPNESLSFIILGLGTVPGGLNLAVIGMPTCLVHSTTELSLAAPTDAAGTGSVSVVIPNLPGLVGAHFFAQGFSVDTAANAFGAIMSDAGDVSIGR